MIRFHHRSGILCNGIPVRHDILINLQILLEYIFKYFTPGDPVSQKWYVTETNGFHIQNQRCRFSLKQVAK